MLIEFGRTLCEVVHSIAEMNWYAGYLENQFEANMAKSHAAWVWAAPPTLR